MVGRYTAATSVDFLLLCVAPSVSCSCIDARLTLRDTNSSTVSCLLPLSPNVYNPSKLTPQPSSSVRSAAWSTWTFSPTRCCTPSFRRTSRPSSIKSYRSPGAMHARWTHCKRGTSVGRSVGGWVGGGRIRDPPSGVLGWPMAPCSYRDGKGPETPEFGKAGASRRMPRQDDGPYRYFVIEAAILFPPAFSFIQRRKASARLLDPHPKKHFVTPRVQLPLSKFWWPRRNPPPTRHDPSVRRARPSPSAADPALFKAGPGSGGWPRYRIPRWPPPPHHHQ